MLALDKSKPVVKSAGNELSAHFATILRQSLFLLSAPFCKQQTQQPQQQDAKHELWFDCQKLRQFVSRQSSESFSFADLSELSISNADAKLEAAAIKELQLISSGDLLIEKLVATSNSTSDGHNSFVRLLRADWFRQFVEMRVSSFAIGAQMRATILSALLIVACLARHRKLAMLSFESLRELVSDKHLFAACSAHSELLSTLGFCRPGQVWLTRNKDSLDALLLSNLADEDDDDEDDEEGDVDSLQELAVGARQEELRPDSDSDGSHTSPASMAQARELLREARQLIDEQLEGRGACFACAQLLGNSAVRALTKSASGKATLADRKSLNVLMLTSSACLSCGQPIEISATSFARLSLAGLQFALAGRTCIGQVSQLCYLRAMLSQLDVSRTLLLPATQPDSDAPFAQNGVALQLTRSVNFERLTLRDAAADDAPSSSPTREPSSSASSSSSSLLSELASGDERESAERRESWRATLNPSANLQQVSDEEKATSYAQAARALLDGFWRSKKRKLRNGAALFQPSETFELQAFARDSPAPFLLVFARDLLVADWLVVGERRVLVKLRLSAGSPQRALFACNSRAPRSGSLLGCRRVFARNSSRTRSGEASSVEPKISQCTHCKLELRQLPSFGDFCERFL